MAGPVTPRGMRSSEGQYTGVALLVLLATIERAGDWRVRVAAIAGAVVLASVYARVRGRLKAR